MRKVIVKTVLYGSFEKRGQNLTSPTYYTMSLHRYLLYCITLIDCFHLFTDGYYQLHSTRRVGTKIFNATSYFTVKPCDLEIPIGTQSVCLHAFIVLLDCKYFCSGRSREGGRGILASYVCITFSGPLTFFPLDLPLL